MVAEGLEVAFDVVVARHHIRQVIRTSDTGHIGDDAAVGFVPVGIGVTGIPRHRRIGTGQVVRAGELPRIGQARRVLHLGLFEIVHAAHVLDAPAFGQTVTPQYIEQVLELDTVRGVEDERPVVHRSEPDIVRILVVIIIVEIDGRVGGRGVDAVPGVLDTFDSFKRIAVCDGGDVAHGTAALRIPAAGHREGEPLVGHGDKTPDAPVVVEPFSRQPRYLVGRSDEVHVRRKRAAERPLAEVETEEIRTASGVHAELPELRPDIKPGRITDFDAVFFGDTFGHYLDETAGEVARYLRRGGFIDQQVVNLTAGNHVEGEGTAVCLGTRDGQSVYPCVVVALRQAAHDDETVVYDGDAGDATDDFRSVPVGAFRYLGRRNTARDLRNGLYRSEHGYLGVAPHTGLHDHLFDLFRIAFEADIHPLPIGGHPARHLDALVGDETDGERIIPRGKVVEAPTALHIGFGSLVGILDHDYGACHRFARGGIGHPSRHGVKRLRRLRRKEGAQRKKKRQNSRCVQSHIFIPNNYLTPQNYPEPVTKALRPLYKK